MDVKQKKNILMIEDDENILTTNERVLSRASGGTVRCFKAKTLAKAREAITEWEYDLVILDIMLPDGSGLDFIPEIHVVTDAPILILSAKNTSVDIIEGITRGGDNYITKPYEPEALTALVLAMLRREEKHGKQESVGIITLGALTLDPVADRAYLNGNDLQLPHKEFSLLLLFTQHEDKIISSEYIYEKVWGVPMGADKSAIQKAISRLRNKIKPAGYSIVNLRGQGYKFSKR